jgi:redox-sensing transcriptional repressor
MKTIDKISEFTIYRLSIYKRCLEQLERENTLTISSTDFAIRFGLNSAQVRKDLAYFGEFGIRGMGYPVNTLKDQIANILGLTEGAQAQKMWKAAIIGAGKLGSALAQYKDFRTHGFEIVAVFDIDLQTSAYIAQQQANLLSTDLALAPMDQLETLIAERQIDLVVLAIPEEAAQQVVDRLVNAGIQAILNFVPVQLLVPPAVKVRTVDIIAELQSLTYHLNRVQSEKSEK